MIQGVILFFLTISFSLVGIAVFTGQDMTKTFKKNFFTPLVILFFFALWKGNYYLNFALMLIFALLMVVRLWNRYSYSKLTIQRSLERDQIFVGEETQYIVEIENRKPLPMPWLQINDLVTKGVHFPETMSVANRVGSNYNVFSDIFSLKWYEKVVRRYPVKPQRRGYFSFGNGELRATDLLGLSSQTLDEKEKIHLLVYPRILPIQQLGFPLKNPFGRKQQNQWIYQDPANKVGVRPYQRGDRFNQINWKATARNQELQSYEIKPTLDSKMLVVLNSRIMKHHWEGYNSDLFELAVTCTASVADAGIKEGYQVGLLTNGIVYEQSSFVKILPGKSALQRQKILKALAMIEPLQQKEIDQMIYRELAKLEVGTVMILITAVMTPGLVDCLRILRKKGYQPTVLYVGEMEAEDREQLAGIPVYLVGQEVAWHEIESIQYH